MLGPAWTEWFWPAPDPNDPKQEGFTIGLDTWSGKLKNASERYVVEI